MEGLLSAIVEGQPAYGMPIDLKVHRKHNRFFVEALEGHPLIPMMLHVTQASKPQKLNKNLTPNIRPAKCSNNFYSLLGPTC